MVKLAVLPSDEELNAITAGLDDVDQVVALSMSHIRRIQGWSIGTLVERFDGINKCTLVKYLQPSYPGIRPIHFIAAYSWITMVLMTSFLNGLKITELERSVDSDAIQAIIQCGRLPKKLFQSMLDIIVEHLSAVAKVQYQKTWDEVTEQYGSLDDYKDSQFLPPSVLDVNIFGDDYYRSIALALQDFRAINQLSLGDMAKGLGLSDYRYSLLENPNISKLKSPYDLQIGIRVRQVFKSYSHVEFTKYMQAFPEFHQLRVVQHIRDTVLVEGLRLMPKKHKAAIIQIMKLMAHNHTHV